MHFIISLKLLILQQFWIAGISILNLDESCLKKKNTAAMVNSSWLNLLILLCKNSANYGVKLIIAKYALANNLCILIVYYIYV